MLSSAIDLSLHDRARPLSGRLRFQLPFGLLLSVIIPGLLTYLLIAPDTFEAQMRNSIVASAVAFLVGLLLTRRLRSFAGIGRAGTEIPIYGTAFALVIGAMLVLRLSYSSLFLTTSILLTLGGFFVMATKLSSNRRMVFMLVPHGDVDRLKRISQTDFVRQDQLLLPPPGSVDGIVADLRTDLPDEWERMLAEAALRGIPVYHVKQVEEALTGRVDIEHLSENSLGSLLPSRAYADLKAVLDRIVAVVVLVVFALPMALAAIAVRVDSAGPVLFRQSRMGRAGVPFTVYKFRSMVHDQDRTVERDAAQTQDGDHRITRVGAVLRRFRIDELPQAINVLKGEMSWIGPRPEALALSDWYDAELPFYKYRHIVKPGVTGWAQVNQGHVSDLSSVHDKLRYDFYYIKHFSLWLDLLIVVQTVRVLVGGYGAR